MTHRFINTDTQISGVGGDVVGYNMYAYCNNNPINKSDPNGHWPRWISASVAFVTSVVAKITSSPVSTAVAVVATVTYNLQCWHYDNRQAKNTNLPETPQQADNQRWINSNPISPSNPNGGGPAANCHQYTATNGPNIKYVSPDGHREVIFDSAGKMVTDPRDIGTYNFKPAGEYWYSKESMEHFFVDIIPWVFLGNSDDDWGPVINFFIS